MATTLSLSQCVKNGIRIIVPGLTAWVTCIQYDEMGTVLHGILQGTFYPSICCALTSSHEVSFPYLASASFQNDVLLACLAYITRQRRFRF